MKRNPTIDRYIISVNEPKMRMILQNMMNYFYEFSDKVANMDEKFDKPIDLSETINNINSSIAQKVLELNNMINSKVSVFDNQFKAMRETLSRNDTNSFNERITSLEKFFDRLDRLEPQDNSDLIKRIEELEKKLSECSKKCDKEPTSPKPKKEKKETKKRKIVIKKKDLDSK